MACAVESTPHEETRIYSSAFDGGDILEKFEDNAPMELPEADAHRGALYPVRSKGEYVTPTNPWPRNAEREERDFASVHKRKPCAHQGPSSRWDQYGEDSSATSSEAHIASDQMSSQVRWGPWESVSKDKRQAQL